MGLSKFFPLSWLLSEERGLLSCIKIAPILRSKESHCIIIFFVKLGVARKRVVHIASLSFPKDLVGS
jgi:hypothetical protein